MSLASGRSPASAARAAKDPDERELASDSLPASPFNPNASPRGFRPSCSRGEPPRVEPSEELRQVVIRFFEALRDGDTEAVSNRLSRQPGFERFGTDPDEVWFDGETAARVLGPADA